LSLASATRHVAHPVGEVARLGQHAGIVRSVVARQQAADQSDDRLEHLEVCVDVEAQVVDDEVDPVVELVVGLHDVQRVQGLDEGQPHRVPAGEEVTAGAGNRVQLVAVAGVGQVGVVGSEEFVSAVLGEVRAQRRGGRAADAVAGRVNARAAAPAAALPR
jgi:hypothetical protein